MVKLVITDEGGVSSDPVEDIAANAKGGTELMRDELFKRISPELLEHFQIICSRPTMLDNSKIKVLWCHDLPEDPYVRNLADPEYRKQFDLFVFVSNWQAEQYKRVLGVPYEKSYVIENAITPLEVGNKSKDKIKLIYTPTPHRGLELLVPVFKKLCEHFDNLELDVFSSFKLYGWEHRDEQHRKVIDECKEHPNINYHGTVSNEEVRKALAESHIFAYPSIWPETSCLCLIEAMSAKCIAVHPNYAALPDTAGGLTMMYQWSEDIQTHANRFGSTLVTAIRYAQAEEVNPILDFTKTYTDYRFSWERRATTWENVLSALAREKGRI